MRPTARVIVKSYSAPPSPKKAGSYREVGAGRYQKQPVLAGINLVSALLVFLLIASFFFIGALLWVLLRLVFLGVVGVLFCHDVSP